MTSSFEMLKSRNAGEWQAYCEHDFVCRLGAGTLPEEAFRHYLKQDYLFLVQFARAWGLAVYRSRDLDEIRQGLESLKAIVEVEIGLHVGYCAEWGISEKALADVPPSPATLAYTGYVLETGLHGDLTDLHVALAPCIIGYGEIALWLQAQPFLKMDGNPYAAWIEMYASADYQALVRSEIAWLDRRLASLDETAASRLSAIFGKATRLETDFWQMGLDIT
ncbi:thiaminase II [Rhizobium sp. NFR03]|uniref:thiaminase II n=1 Tax=Rhizobium sp. NFR03 TaxID=1566263 RepID=UPI0008CB0B34|nr:thiaminase II [Rhizobium sp. NFR03]SES37726.1 thiaminase (transcriptional activator TenA) [Rhizobium sp. NFR03]